MKKILCLILLSTILFSCSKDEPKLMVNTTSVSLYSGYTHLITTTNGTNVTFESQNPYIAIVNETTGEVTAMTIGSTIINVYSDQGNAKVEINVNKKYNTYTEPCTDFSKTMSQIIAMYGEPDSQTDNGIIYVHNKTKHFADMYFFDNTLESSIAIIPQDYAVEAMKFLLERYLPIGTQDDMYIFANGTSPETVTMGVSMSKMSGYTLYQIIYIPYTSSNTRSIKSTISNIKIDTSILEKLSEYKE